MGYFLQCFELEDIAFFSFADGISMMELVGGGQLLPAINFLSLLQPKYPKCYE